jgi:GNAT superfamily N-acetyltransferase
MVKKATIKIRRATSEDLEDILRLNHELFELENEKFDPGLDMEWTFGRHGRKYFSDIINTGFAAVAMCGGKAIGYAAGFIGNKEFYSKNRYAELENMYIEEEYRGRGAGGMLYGTFKKYCDDNDAKEIRITASARNKKAIVFYKRLGFEPLNETLILKMGVEK